MKCKVKKVESSQPHDHEDSTGQVFDGGEAQGEMRWPWPAIYQNGERNATSPYKLLDLWYP